MISQVINNLKIKRNVNILPIEIENYFSYLKSESQNVSSLIDLYKIYFPEESMREQPDIKSLLEIVISVFFFYNMLKFFFNKKKDPKNNKKYETKSLSDYIRENEMDLNFKFFENLPKVISCYIFGYLEERDLFTLIQVSKKMKEICSSPFLW